MTETRRRVTFDLVDAVNAEGAKKKQEILEQLSVDYKEEKTKTKVNGQKAVTVDPYAHLSKAEQAKVHGRQAFHKKMQNRMSDPDLSLWWSTDPGVQKQHAAKLIDDILDTTSIGLETNGVNPVTVYKNLRLSLFNHPDLDAKGEHKVDDYGIPLYHHGAVGIEAKVQSFNEANRVEVKRQVAKRESIMVDAPPALAAVLGYLLHELHLWVGFNLFFKAGEPDHLDLWVQRPLPKAKGMKKVL